MQAYASIEAQISDLRDASSAALAQADNLYSNIEYTLAATLCHANTLPCATIATHLSTLRDQLSMAQDEMKTLQREWDACLWEEQDAWEELSSGAEQKRYLRNEDKATRDEVESFKAEARSILDENEQALDELDAVRASSCEAKYIH